MATIGNHPATPETEPVDLSEEVDGLISTMVSDCQSNFSKSHQFLESNGEERWAIFLRKLEKRFVDWAAYIGVFAEGNASLDHRLKRHPRYADLILLDLDMLKMNLIQSKAVAKSLSDCKLTEC